MDALRRRLAKAKPIDEHVVLTPRLEDLPSCFEIYDCWRRVASHVFAAFDDAEGAFAQADRERGRPQLYPAWVAAKSEVFRGEGGDASVFAQQPWPKSRGAPDAEAWAEQLDWYASMLAPLALLTPKVLSNMRDKLDELGPHDADDTLSICDRVAEYWANATRCLFETDVPAFREQANIFDGDMRAFLTMWRVAFEAEEWKDADEKPRRWLVQVWPGEPAGLGRKSSVIADLCSPDEKRRLADFRGDALIALYPLRALADRHHTLLQGVCRDETLTLFAFARSAPEARHTPGFYDGDSNYDLTALGKNDQYETSSEAEPPAPEKPRPAKCGSCGKAEGKLFLCTRCKKVSYCSPACQRSDWRFHRRVCKPPTEKAEIDKYGVDPLL